MGYDERLIREKLLEMWSNGWSLDYIVTSILREERHLLPRAYRQRIALYDNDSADADPNASSNYFHAGLRARFGAHLLDLGLCDRQGRAPPIGVDVLHQLAELDRHLPLHQLVDAFRVGISSNGSATHTHFARMDARLVEVALRHAARATVLAAQAAAWDRQHVFQTRLEHSIDDLLANGPMRDERGQLVPGSGNGNGKVDGFENPFARYLADNGRRGYTSFFDGEEFAAVRRRAQRNGEQQEKEMQSPASKTVTERMCTDPTFGFASVGNRATGESWTEDADGEVVMKGDEPPWGWMPRNTRHTYGFEKYNR